jgi:PTS system nitrogen regulatory IIA component
MTTKELAEYLRLHEITICKYAAKGEIPAKRIGNVWRFDRDTIDAWITAGGRSTPRIERKAKAKFSPPSRTKKPRRKQRVKRK